MRTRRSSSGGWIEARSTPDRANSASGCRPSGSRMKPHGWPGRTSAATGRANSIPFRGCTAISCATWPASKKCAFWLRTKPPGKARAAFCKSAPSTSMRSNFSRIPPIEAGRATYCPIFVRDAKGAIVAGNWKFNGWAKYDNWRQDNAVPKFLASRLKLPEFEPGIVLEGGSIDVNGAGLLLTTQECLLDKRIQVRNPGLGARRVGALFRRLSRRRAHHLAQEGHRRR